MFGFCGMYCVTAVQIQIRYLFSFQGFWKITATSLKALSLSKSFCCTVWCFRYCVLSMVLEMTCSGFVNCVPV